MSGNDVVSGSDFHLRAMRAVDVVSVFIAVSVAVLEVGSLIPIELTRGWVGGAMWVGALLWIGVAVAGWHDALTGGKEDPFFSAALFVSIVATGSFLGIFVSGFEAFAMWANAIVGVIFAIGAATLYYKDWFS